MISMYNLHCLVECLTKQQQAYPSIAPQVGSRQGSTMILPLPCYEAVSDRSSARGKRKCNIYDDISSNFNKIVRS